MHQLEKGVRVHAHTFVPSQDIQLLINVIRQLFTDHVAASALKVTTPTGIAADNIRGSTIFSLLSLLSHTLTGERILCIQMVMGTSSCSSSTNTLF